LKKWEKLNFKKRGPAKAVDIVGELTSNAGEAWPYYVGRQHVSNGLATLQEKSILLSG